jgi:hypothetical protein
MLWVSQPFSAIYIELFYVFSSVWGHKARGAHVLWALLALNQSSLNRRSFVKCRHAWRNFLM